MRPIFGNEYWSLTRNPVIGLMFVTPLWLLYEFSAYEINHGWQGHFRTGTDLLLKKGLNGLGIVEWQSVAVPLLLLIIYFGLRVKSLAKIQLRPVHFAYMLLESLFYALCFGVVVGGFTGFFLTPQINGLNQSKVAALIVHLGSGVYEEFFFRFVFISITVLIFSKVFHKDNAFSYPVAVFFGSLVFAFTHYLDIFGEPLRLDTFLFRFFSGLVLSLLFIVRGYGITAYTHSLYNVLLMFRY
ncbi:MAG: type II CAAX prenyl endopeptidase Rce1 family protein [bacterium]